MINTKILFTIKTDKTGNINLSYTMKDKKNAHTEQEYNFLKYVEMLINATLQNGLGIKEIEDGKANKK